MDKRASARSKKGKGRRVRTKKLPFTPGLSVYAYHTNGRQLRFINQTQTEYLSTDVQLCHVPRPDSRNSIFLFSLIFQNQTGIQFAISPIICYHPSMLQQVQWCGQGSTGGKDVCMVSSLSADWAYQPGMVANSLRGQLNRENRLRTRNRKSQHTSRLRHSRPCRCQ